MSTARQLPVLPRRLLGLLAALAVAGFVGFAVLALLGSGAGGRRPAILSTVLDDAVVILAGLMVALRAAVVRGERAAWATIAAGILLVGAGFVAHSLQVTDLDRVPIPSIADVLWLSAYPVFFVGLVLLLRSRRPRLRRGVWVDAAIAVLSIGAVTFAVLFEPIMRSTRGSTAAVITSLGYPLGDLLVLSLVMGVFSRSGWRPGRTCVVLGSAFLLSATADTLHLHQVASGTYQPGTLLDLTWPLMMLALAYVAWLPAPPRADARPSWREVVVPTGFAILALGVTAVDSFAHVGMPAMVMATAALALAFVRTATGLAAVRSAAGTRDLLERNAAILEAAGDGIVGVDIGGRVTFLNAAAARMTGHEPAQLVGRSLHDVVHKPHEVGTRGPVAACSITASLSSGSSRQLDGETFWRADGTSFPVDYTSTPVVEDGEVKGAVVVFKDITERRRAEAALAASEHQTRQILETAHDGFVAIDAGGRIIDWNPQAAAIFGWSRDEALGRELADTIVPEGHRVAHRRGMEHYLATGEGPVLGKRLELTALHRDGRQFPIELTISALQVQDDRFFHAFVRDISERRAAEELRESQRRQLVEAQSVGGFGSWDWDLASNTTEWSDELLRLHGIEPGQGNITFEEYLQYVHEDDRADVSTAVQTTYATGEAFSIEHRIVRPDGAVRVTHSRGELVAGADGTPLKMLGIAQDITERHAVERAKDEFTSVVSHELRTPLTSIRGSLGLLASGTLGPLSDKAQRMADIAVHNSDRLVRLINDILDVERMASGKITMEREACELKGLVNQAAEVMRPMAAEAGVELTVEAPSATLWADADRIVQTLTNLFSNAIKFSQPGGRVSLEVEQRDAEIVVRVRDEGRGIPQDSLESIFERFEQVDASDARAKGGSGLGLAICRSIVEQHGGRIRAQSTPGEGSTLSFTLPMLQPAGPALLSRGPAPQLPRPAPGEHLSDERTAVLVCDDDESVLEVVGAMLSAHGYRPVLASSGEEALARAAADRPQAILLDLLMPGLSGWETAAALGERPETSDIPIVILSVLPPQETEPPPGEVVGWVEKPLEESSLFAVLDRALEARPASASCVLVVEDDDDLAGILCAMFERRGLRTARAATSREAIEMSRRLEPDLLVLDLLLPDGDGYEIVRALRDHNTLRHAPTVIYTACDVDASQRERLRLGTTHFVTKGTLTPEDFEQRVIDLLGSVTREKEYAADVV